MNANMGFKIEASNPKNNAIIDNDDTKLSEAIYTLFPLEAEDAMLSWGDVRIPLSYRYDISTMVDDLIQMIFVLKSKDDGEWFVDWSSNTFAVNWTLKWSEDDLEILAQWRDEFHAGDYLKENNVLNIEKKKFFLEWKKIIDVLLSNLIECGYNCDNLIDMGNLVEVSKMLKN